MAIGQVSNQVRKVSDILTPGDFITMADGQRQAESLLMLKGAQGNTTSTRDDPGKK